jgi:pimeloyl-ACP methyl ester carboxylesterase
MPRTARLLLLPLLAFAFAVTGCGGSSPKTASTTTAAPARAQGPRDAYGTVWLCRPGLTVNPCTSSLTATVFDPKGGSGIVGSRIPANPPVDCFYVYPTISPEETVNANLQIDLNLREVAVAQASRFSQACRVYAPVYRQITLHALSHPATIKKANALLAYGGVVAAFRDYLAHYNDGRGIVFIGHSQGASILIRLLQRQVDFNAGLRRRLVSAILLGGNVTVRKGSRVGGDFAHIPACASPNETGCVVAYSSFSSKPPPNSQFARVGSDAGVPLLAPRRPQRDLAIMCVNPTSLGGGTGVLDPYFPTILVSLLPGAKTQGVTTPWIAIPGEYSAHCETSGNATWLQVTPIAGTRLQLGRVRNSVIGLHLIDVNAALGNLVPLVAAEAAAYKKR